MATFAFEVKWANMSIFQMEINKWTNPIESFKLYMTGGIKQ